MSREDGGPAFPIERSSFSLPQDGMTLRDYFAAKASDADIEDQARIRWPYRPGFTNQDRPRGWRQVARFMHADAMLAARKENDR